MLFLSLALLVTSASLGVTQDSDDNNVPSESTTDIFGGDSYMFKTHWTSQSCIAQSDFTMCLTTATQTYDTCDNACPTDPSADNYDTCSNTCLCALYTSQ